MAVIDDAPGRWDQAHIDSVLFRQQSILLGLFDLHLAHPEAKKPHKADLRPAQNQPATCNQAGAFF